MEACETADLDSFELGGHFLVCARVKSQNSRISDLSRAGTNSYPKSCLKPIETNMGMLCLNL